MFRGITNLNIDTKGRLAMPSRYRDAITMGSAGQIVVTVDHMDRCLLVYPMSQWNEVEKQLNQLSNMNRRARSVQRLLIGYAHDCEMDSQGRILITAPLREYAGLDKKSVLVGQNNKFELWSAEKWQEQTDVMLSDAQDSPYEMDVSLSGLKI